MLNKDALYLDRDHLCARGWTQSLITNYLGEPDRLITVNHWMNYSGKAAYHAERVMTAESHPEFTYDFGASLRRRRVTQEQQNRFLEARERQDRAYQALIESALPEDEKLRAVISRAAAIFDNARALGYRTPHK